MAPGTVRGWSTGHRAPGPASGWKNEDGEKDVGQPRDDGQLLKTAMASQGYDSK